MKICIRLCCLLIVVICGSAWTSFAVSLSDIIKDMQPVEGYVVDVVNGQIIIDLGSEAGVQKDDIFTVFQVGKKLTDPVTGKVLGRIESRAGLIGVSRVEKIFSYAKSLDKKIKVKRGDKLVRFKEISAVGVDKSGHSGHFFFGLKQGLQALNWLEKNKTKAELTFIREGELLKVQNRKGKVIREYQIDVRPVIATPAAAPPANKYAPVYAAGAGGAVAAATAASTGKVHYDMQTYGYDQGGSLPFSAVMGDFLMLKGQMNLAVIQEHALAVYQVTDNGLQNVAKVKLPLIKLVSVCWWQPGAGTPYIAVTGYDKDEDDISSFIFRFNKGTITPVQRQFPYILGSSDIDGDGLPETLLAQSFDRDTFYSRGGIRQVKITGNTVKTVNYGTSLPTSFRVTGGMVFQPVGESGKLSAYIMGKKLHLFNGSREVYLSGKEMGGSLSSVRYVQNPGDVNPLFSNANIEVRPLAVDIDNDGTREIVVPSADLSVFSTVGGASDIKKTWVSVLKKTQAGSYMKGKIGGNYDQYIQGIGTSNGALYLLTVSSGGLFSEAKGSSRLLILPLQE
jgi:hypothetical protein